MKPPLDQTGTDDSIVGLVAICCLIGGGICLDLHFTFTGIAMVVTASALMALVVWDLMT